MFSCFEPVSSSSRQIIRKCSHVAIRQLKNLWRIKNGACRFPHRFRSRQHNPAAGAAPCPNTSHARCNSASAPRACCGRNTAGRAQAKPGLRKTPLFFEFSLCLSRACLGKMSVFIYKWRKNWRFSHHSRGSACRPSRRGSESCRGGSRGGFPYAHKTSAPCMLEDAG
jgi:hypothetical protein